jgi:MFS family permease
VVFAVVLTAVLEVLDSTIVNVTLPHMKAAFGINTTKTTRILTSYIVASVVVMPLTAVFRAALWPSPSYHHRDCRHCHFFRAFRAWRDRRPHPLPDHRCYFDRGVFLAGGVLRQHAHRAVWLADNFGRAEKERPETRHH